MELRELFATFGLKFDPKGFNDAEGLTNKLIEAAKGLGIALASAAVVKGLFNLVEGVAESANEIANLSARTNVATDDLQRLGVIAGTSSLDLDGLAESVEDVQEKFADAAQDPAADLGQKFRRWGVDIRNANGEVRSGTDALLTYLDAVAAEGNAATRTLMLSEISGEFRRLGPFVANGTNEVRALMDELGGFPGITGDVIESSQDLTRQTAILDFAWTSLKSSLARELLPAFVDAARWGVRVSRSFLEMAKNSNFVRAVFITLGAVMVAVGVATFATWAPVVGTFLLIAGAVAAVVLIVDDLITFLEGGNSAIGEFLDKLFGIGTAQNVLDGLRMAWESIKTTIDGVRDAFDYLWNTMGLGDAIIGTLRSALTGISNVFSRLAEFGGRIGNFLADWAGVGTPQEERTNRRGFADPGRSRGRLVGGVTAPTQVGARSVTQTNQINVDGARDPRAVAREVDRQLERRARQAQAALGDQPA